MTRLTSVYKYSSAYKILYDLMKERKSHVNISHLRLPSYQKHIVFVKSKPYKAWYFVRNGEDEVVGAAYLSKTDEVGLFIFKRFQGKGHGKEALKLLMSKHRGVKRILANINPKNKRSIVFFKEFGFRHIQNTYELRLGKVG